MMNMEAVALLFFFIIVSFFILEIVWRENFEMNAVIEELHFEERNAEAGGPRWYVYVLLENGRRVCWDVSKRQFDSVFVGGNMRIHCSRGRIFGDITIEEEEGSWHEDIYRHPPGR